MRRRQFLRKFTSLAGALIVGASLSLGSGQPALGGGELRYLGWEIYVKDAWIDIFEEQYDVTVIRTYVGSNDEYMAKLAAGGGQYYDVVTIVSSLSQPAIKAGFVEPLELELIPNLSELFPTFQSSDIMLDEDGNLYGGAFVWGTNPVTVNAEKFPRGNDFGILFDSKYAGRITMWDDTSTIGDVANWMGYDNIWDLTDDQLDAVKNKMCEQKKLVRKYWSHPGEGVELFASGEVWASNSYNYITQELKKQGYNVREFVPEPTIGWIDTNYVVKGAKNRELANKFINFFLDPKIQGMIAEATAFSVTNPGSKAYMGTDLWEDLYMDEGPTILKTMKFWDEIPRRDKYLEIWNEIKACPT